MNHRFAGKREYGLQPGPDDKCVKCDVRYASHNSTGITVDEGQLAVLHDEISKLKKANVDAATKVLIADLDKRSAEQRVDMFREQASLFYDIKGWLRLCEDTPEGHAEFYEQCARIIFPDQYPTEEDDSNES